MAANNLVDILTESHEIPATVIISPAGQPDERAKTLWGLVFDKVVTKSDESHRSYIETERVIDLYFEGLESKGIYVARNTSVEKASQFVTNVQQDLFFRIFGSTELYKAFFGLLNSDYKSGNISIKQYRQIHQQLNNINNEIYSTLFNRFALHKIVRLQMINFYLQFHNVEHSKLITDYLERAKNQ